MMLATLLQDLSRPEYIHVVINPLPVYGLAMGCLGLVVAVLLQRAAQRHVQHLDPSAHAEHRSVVAHRG